MKCSRIAVNRFKETVRNDLASDMWKSHKIKVTPRTVRNYQANLHGGRARHNRLLSEHHKKFWLKWAKEHVNWAKFIWSDESNIEQVHYGYQTVTWMNFGR
ncbi:hypothetical protein QE152_g19992 [Popillia japonica]|uniref:Transposase Tc1-like domain-containing protein n=1 Tax=Popillia japonica TaxID=7064 RepID=A0AAW1KPN3_POPJA